MTQATALDMAIAEIHKRGAMRTHDLAELLGIGEAAVDAMLAPAWADGRLVTCAVELAGGRHVTEYRCSASGGGSTAHPLRVWRPNAAQVLVKAETSYGTAPTPSEGDAVLLRPALDMDAIYRTRKEPPQVNLIERAQALFKKHGPMTARQVRDVDAVVAVQLKRLCDNATLGKLGGKTSGVIYGLPDQSAADVKQVIKDAPPTRAIRKRKAQKRSKVSKKRAARRAFKAPVKAASRGFRPALAADGALLFMGAKNGDFEIDRAHCRIVVDLVRRLTGDELVAAVEFVERLDKAEVGA